MRCANLAFLCVCWWLMSAPRKVTIDFTLLPLPSTAKWLIRAVIFARCANLAFYLMLQLLIRGILLETRRNHQTVKTWNVLDDIWAPLNPINLLHALLVSWYQDTNFGLIRNNVGVGFTHLNLSFSFYRILKICCGEWPTNESDHFSHGHKLILFMY